MADESKPQSKGIAGNSLIVAVLALFGTAFYLPQVALQTERPPSLEIAPPTGTSIEEVAARLWEDPFSAAAKESAAIIAKENDVVEKSKDKSVEELYCGHNLCRSPLDGFTTTSEEKLPVLIVTVPGGFFAADVETRRRTRYAIASALQLKGLSPKSENHLRYFRSSSFFPSPSEAGPRKRHEAIVPYEWFTDDDGNEKKALVLWLNEDHLHDGPITQLANFVNDLCKSNDKGCDALKVSLKIIGPFSSTTLHAIAHDKDSKDNKPNCTANLKKVEVYVYGATYNSDPELNEITCPQLHRTIAKDELLADEILGELAKRGVQLDGGNDHIALISEWDTIYGRTFPKEMLNRCLQLKIACKDDVRSDESPLFLNFDYIRGLDGKTAANADVGRADDKDTAPSPTEVGVPNVIKSFLGGKTEPSDPERPYGPGQYDYLRRIASGLLDKDRELRESRGSIKAIGIVGSDVFDKLLILRALRPAFPEALFFTTDLDSALLMPNERTFTRNLIVASSFHFKLREELQASIPPFRGNYQTSAFYAACVALSCPKFGDLLQPDMSARLRNVEKRSVAITPEVDAPPPLLFEITRSGKPMLLNERDCENDHSPCGVQPHFSKPSQYSITPLQNTKNRLVGLSFLAVAILLFIFMLAFSRALAFRKDLLITVCVICAVSGLAALSWDRIVVFLTSDGVGEPLSLEGVSIWPTIFLRCLGILVSIYFAYLIIRKGDANLVEVAKDLRLAQEGETIKDLHRAADKIARESDSSENWSMMTFPYYFARAEQKENSEKPNRYSLVLAWAAYVHRGKLKMRLIRASCYLVLATAFWIVTCNLFAFPQFQARGEWVRSWYFYITCMDLLCLQGLIFLVLDATILCLSLVRELGKQNTVWPDKARDYFADRLNLRKTHEIWCESISTQRTDAIKNPTYCTDADSVWSGGLNSKKIKNPSEIYWDNDISRVIDDWIDLVFIEQRTKCITEFIFYPFIVIALLMLSRSSFFAADPPDTATVIVIGTSLIVTFVCAFWLPQAAEKARNFSKRDITAAIVYAKGLEGRGERLGLQLEALLSRVNALHEGAFSPFSEQPVTRAVLLPLTSLGGTSLFEYFAL